MMARAMAAIRHALDWVMHPPAPSEDVTKEVEAAAEALSSEADEVKRMAKRRDRFGDTIADMTGRKRPAKKRRARPDA